MNVLSLFDGMSAGQIALNRLGIKVDNYFASEIDKYAIAVTQFNFPNTVQLGDVTQIRYEDGKLYSASFPDGIEVVIDLVIGGFPCQSFSFSGGMLAFDDPRGKLYFEFERLIKEVKPKYWLGENVQMQSEHSNIISERLGVDFIKIDSSLVSGQSRKRLYWTNIKGIEQPKDKQIYLMDIIESGITDSIKSYCIDANYFKGGNLKQYLEKSRRQLIFEVRDKSKTVRSGGRNSLDRHEWDDVYKNSHHRKLTPIECERLQTIPDNFSAFGNFNGTIKPISNSQRYKMLGNSFTVDVIAHILSYAEF